jgi:ATPase family AAA domain-containing protein 2
MPNHYKRKFEDFDPNASDPDDDDYDAKAERAAKPKQSKSQPKKRSKRSRRSGYDSDGSEDPSEDDLSEEDYEDVDDPPEEEEDVEINERTGRPKRKTTKKTTTYEESDTNDDDLVIEGSEPEEKPRKRLTVKLKVNTPAPTPGPGRTSRAGSATRSRRGLSNEPQSAGTRRSSRLHHDEHDPVVALTGSGKHVEIIRPATKSPETKPGRPTRGSKGIKAPSTIVEAEDEASIAPEKSEQGDNTAQPEESTSTRPHTDRKNQSGQTRDPDILERDGIPVLEKTDTQNATQGDSDIQMLEDTPVAGLAPETDADINADGDDDDDDEEPISKGGRTGSARVSKEAPIMCAKAVLASEDWAVVSDKLFLQTSRAARNQRPSREPKKQRKGGGGRDDSDFEVPDEEGDEDMSSNSEVTDASPRKGSRGNDEEDYESSNTRRSGRLAKGPSKRSDSVLHEGDEIAEELEELKAGDRPRRVPRTQEIIYDSRPHLRRRKRDVDYRIVKPDVNLFPDFAEEAPSASPSRRSRATGGGAWQRNLFSTYGPFGGAGGPPPVFGNRAFGATGGVDSDSSDDEKMQRPGGLGGTVGMTPTSAAPPGLLAAGQSHNMDPLQGPSGTPANLGKIKNRQALADADPLGVDQNVSFDKVGGLEDHINQLKEMVSLPLLYPEIFQRFKVTPPRGVLFHGPPGTGKTLLARALAASCSSEGRKITFYMRKGADALSKWVGEAERQLRLLFEEARNNQPSIIFFDEIDGMKSLQI